MGTKKVKALDPADREELLKEAKQLSATLQDVLGQCIDTVECLVTVVQKEQESKDLLDAEVKSLVEELRLRANEAESSRAEAVNLSRQVDNLEEELQEMENTVARQQSALSKIKVALEDGLKP